MKRTDLPIVFFFLNRLNVKENAVILGHANDLALATRGEYMLAHFDANQARGIGPTLTLIRRVG